MTDPLQTARLEYKAQRYRSAIKWAQDVLTVSPDNSEATQIFGLANLRCGEITEGTSALERLTRLRAVEAIDRRQSSSAMRCRATVAGAEASSISGIADLQSMLIGQPASLAEVLIQNVIDLEPGNVSFRIGLASLLIQRGRKYEALVIIDNLIPARLSEITCHRCLKRIANFFFDCDDLERTKLCVARMVAIQSANTVAPSSQRPEALQS
ncbi:MAG: hypothetical protein AAF539_01555 [Planctomycetota bacterium]